jgi:hypothetical protein
MRLQLRHSHAVATSLLWDNFLALSSLAALSVIVTYLAAR